MTDEPESKSSNVGQSISSTSFPIPAQKTETNLKAEINQILYEYYPLNFVALIFASSLVYWVSNIFESQFLYVDADMTWYFLMLLIVFSRLFAFLWYKKTKNNEKLFELHFNTFILGASLTALMWGLLLIIIDPVQVSDLLFYLLIIFGIVGGATQTLPASLLLSILCILLCLTPSMAFVIYKLIQGNHVQLFTAILITIAVYTVFLIFVAYRLNVIILKRLGLTIEKLDLMINLENSKEQLEKIINSALEGVWYIDESFRIIYASKRLCDMIGYKSDEIVGKSVFDVMDNKNKTIVMEHALERYKTHSTAPQQYELKVFKKNHEPIWVRVVSTPEYVKPDHMVRFLGVITDITSEQKYSEEKLKSEEKYRNLIELSPSGIMVLVEDKIKYINNAFIKILNGKNKTQFLDNLIYDYIDPSYHTLKRNRLKYVYKNKHINEPVEETFIARNGKIKCLHIMSAYIEYEGKDAALIIASDVTAIKKYSNKIYLLESYDSMTGLASRKLLFEELKNSIFAAKENLENGFVVFYINLDRLKSINDNFGLKIGDLLIQAIANKFKEIASEGDLISRLEGDEFVILFRGNIKESAGIIKFAQLINHIANETYILDGRKVQISTSVGISIFPEDGDNELDLLHNAHLAMHAAKEKGGNTYQFFTPRIKEKILRTLILEKRLREAIEKDEIHVEYQPRVSLKTGKIEGLEALARWTSPIEGNIPPNEFIPLAEKTGLITPLTNLILELICKQLYIWKKNNVPLYRTAINLSSHNFDMTFIEKFLSLIEQYQLDAKLFEIELTESTFFQNLEKNSIILNRFKSMGLKVSIDDFGTGYSTLSYLHSLNIDSLKIDISFIRGLPKEESSSVLVSAIINMAHSLNMSVIAEGVEKKEQLEALIQKGCDEIQGFYITQPLTAEKLEVFIKKYKGFNLAE